MSKSKSKDDILQDEGNLNLPDPEPTFPTTTSDPEATTDYGVGGIYRSIGNGKRVKV